MKVFITSDHGGYEKKAALVDLLKVEFTLEDLGPFELNTQDDYPVFAKKLADAVLSTPASLGIILCRSGEGAAMAANKIDGIRAAVVWAPEIARETRQDNNSNILALPADQLSLQELQEIITVFLNTPFSGEQRHLRRIEQIEKLEEL